MKQMSIRLQELIFPGQIMSDKHSKQPTKRPFYKRVITYHRHFTKYLYERDTVFATLWVFAFIVVLGMVPINFYFLNPLKLALKDFDFNDITYAKQGKTTVGKSGDSRLDPHIVIVNIGHADREVLSFMIEKAAELKPKVIGLDVLFNQESDDPHKDSVLKSVLAKQQNIVVVNRLNLTDTSIGEVNGFYKDLTLKRGFAHLPNDDPEERKTVRQYTPYRKVHEDKYYSFGAALVKEYSEQDFEKLEKRHKEFELLDYSRHTDQYLVVEGEDLLAGNVQDSAFIGKIVLLGYVNTNPNDIEDKFFTPMNPKFAGKSTPDMNGIVIHANFISMVLENNYIKKVPSWVNWLVAILICWLHMSFFVRYYLENHIWFHLVAKIAQLISAIFFAYLGMLLFERYNIKLDMKMSLIVIVMAVDVIYFYEAFAVWMHKKFHYHTVFHHHQH
jgi:CHASE2 domain-containing sensor protein